jgi:hypothetical protein
MITVRILARAAAAAALGVGFVSAAWAVPALTFTPPAVFSAGNANQCVGWQFDVLQPTTVTGLGWFDDNADGLGLAHQVGIWSPTGVLLTSTTVPAGTGAPFDGQFRTVAVTPITLVPGNGYIVGGENFTNSPDRLASNVPAQTVFPTLRYVDATFSLAGPGLIRPTNLSVAENGFYGPSFSVVPEPSIAAGGVTLAALLLRRRRR